MVVIKIILTISFLFIFLQDFKERMVYWFLFPVIGLLCALLFYSNTIPELFYNALKMNLAFVIIFVLIILLYAKLKLKTSVLKTIGLGDLLLFVAVSLAFSTISFIVIFICALIFSLTVHLVLSKNQKDITVPLAGYMSLFFLAIYLVQWSGYVNIYTM
ncbi:hypothetical protein Q4Q34_07720 [Flavivirga abyssicola]|uniref:hypothetical protein n=1 Tax=Flavivirga abyssicola TaxID=3063533 RepID=UPI0026DFA3FF|nr:hypothetical protein [Flavivirga sp. MEBiC07777]WVK14913.1 hypothetical protein Q4Q34_07720 [Flavivirga sp. MEBiC07777]